MGKVVYWLSGALSVISVVLLAEHAFKFGFAASLGDLFEYYDRLVGIALGWTEPYIRDALALFPWHLQLDPAWRHIFVFISILASPGIVTFAREGKWGAALITAAEVLGGILIISLIPPSKDPSGYLTYVATVTLVAAVLMIVLGAVGAYFLSRRTSGMSFKAARASGFWFQIGLRALTIFAGALVVILCNAGLKYAGL